MNAVAVFPIRIDFEAGAGIQKKAAAQVKALRTLGVDTNMVVGRGDGVLWDGELAQGYPKHLPVSIAHHSAFWWGLAALLECKRYDLLFVRYPMMTPFFSQFLLSARVRRTFRRVVVEIPTYPYEREVGNWKQRMLANSDRVLSPSLRYLADRVVTYYGQDEIYGVPCFKMTNGCDVTAHVLRSERPSEGPPRLVTVANVALWHGIDRIISGMTNDSTFHLDVVGDGPDLERLKTLALQSRIAHRVHFPGIKNGSSLDGILETADLAVGSLGLHRLGLVRASSLKTREYAARGLGFIHTGGDSDFASAPFVHEVAPDDSTLSDVWLESVLREARARRAVILDEARKWAESRLSWEARFSEMVSWARA